MECLIGVACLGRRDCVNGSYRLYMYVRVCVRVCIHVIQNCNCVGQQTSKYNKLLCSRTVQ